MKLPLRVLIPALLLTLGLIQSFYLLIDSTHRENQEIDTTAVRALQITMNQLQGNMEFLLRAENLQQAQELLASSASDPNLEIGVLTDGDNLIIASIQLEHRQLAFDRFLQNGLATEAVTEVKSLLRNFKQNLKSQVWISEQGNSVLGIYPVQLGVQGSGLRPDLVGILFLKRDLRKIKQDAMNKHRRNISQIAIFQIALAVLIGILLNHVVTRKVYHLISVTDKFAHGDLSARADEQALSELSRLARSFNNMAVEVQQAQTNLEEKMQENRLLLNSTAEAIYGIDKDGKCIFVNPSMLQIMGYGSENELLNKNIHELIHYKHADGSTYPDTDCPTGQVAKTGEAIHRDNEVFWRKNGEPFPVEYWAHPIKKNDECVGAVVTFFDITERKKVERMKNEFVSIVSHELRTPLTSIMGSLSLLRGALDKLPAEKVQSLLDISHRNSERLLLLINDILDIEKIESGNMEYKFEAIDVVPLVESVVQENKGYADRYHVDFVVSKRLSSATIYADKNRLAQVVWNLLSNASKFSEPHHKVEITIAGDDDRIRVAVRNTGTPIPEKDRERIFEKFTQADSTDARNFAGTGLGLSISRAIIESHHGRIDFVSSTDGVTEFYFELPVARKNPGVMNDSACA